jgi:hypothetical protein
MSEIEKYETKADFLAAFKNLQFGEFLPATYTDKQKEAVVEATKPSRTKTSMYSSIPMHCRGEKCSFADTCPLQKQKIAPVGSPCHPAGTMITSKDGEIAIEDLFAYEGKLWGWERKYNAVRSGKGFNFSIQKKHFSGNMISIYAGEYSHQATYDHISAARFNEKALNKFVVYLMRKDEFYRIGKTKLFHLAADNHHGHKTNFGLAARAWREQADEMWILGVYDTNTEALLMEEFYSIDFKTSKTCFASTLERIESKHNGLYKWVTQEQLDNHYKLLQQPACFYALKLEQIGRSIDYPIWRKGGFEIEAGKFGINNSLFLRACNIIPEIMDVPVLDDNKEYKVTMSRQYKIAKWKTIDSISFDSFEGEVFSLDVETHKTYFANKIATHNCPIEMAMVVQFTGDYMDQMKIDEDNLVEISLIRNLVDYEVQYLRASKFLAKESFIQENVVGIDQNGEVILKKELHLAVELQEKLLKRQRDLLKQLMATREAKAKVGLGAADTAQAMANLMSEFKQLNAASERAQLQKLGMLDYDPFIEEAHIIETNENG